MGVFVPRVSRSSGDCMEGSGARQASDVKPKLKSYITKGDKYGLGLVGKIEVTFRKLLGC